MECGENILYSIFNCLVLGNLMAMGITRNDYVDATIQLSLQFKLGILLSATEPLTCPAF